MAADKVTLLDNTEVVDKKIPDQLELEEPIEDVITEENSKAIFLCKIDGHPQPIFTWYKDGKPITSNQRTKTASEKKWHRLEINRVSVADHGMYSIVCQTNSKQSSFKANLYVAYNNLNDGVFYTHNNCKSIKVVKHLCPVKIEKGERIELEATFEHEVTDGVIDYVWLKNNEVIKQNDRTIILSSKNSTSLSLLRSELTDSGIYYVIAKTKKNMVSSYTDVQVTAFKEFLNYDELLPYIEEDLPDEVETNENDDIRLICKASFDINTSIQWHRNGTLVDKSNFVLEDYGNRYIGLKGVNVSKVDAGEYYVTIQDEKTGRKATSSCFVTVNTAPTKVPPTVQLKRPLQSAVACCGSKVTFYCRFSINDPSYFFVVWHVGHYRVERTNSRFSVICKGEEFLLYIKKLEPGMSGEVVCELRKALPNQRSVYVISSTADLTIVPSSTIQEEKQTHSSGKLFNETTPCEDVELPETSTTIGNGSVPALAGEVILDCSLCRLDEDGLFYIQASKGDSEVVVSRLSAYIKPKMSNIAVIQWDNSETPVMCWYKIEVGQSDGSFVEAGLSSLPSFEIQDPPVEYMIRVRVTLAPRPIDVTESSVCIGPTSEAVLKPLKTHNPRSMDEFELDYAKTGDVIGCGAFGSVVLVRDGKGEYFAAKVLKTRTQKKRVTAMREFEIMKLLRHPKLVQLTDAFVGNDAFILIMDYLWGGELFDRIVEEEHIKEVDVVPYVRQICEALKYLHTYNIAHLDLKPENIICLSPNSGQVKIIDFGLARVLVEGHNTRAIYGTREYVAPEVLNYENLTLACDMWSLGVVTYILLSGVMPFAGETWLERSAKITLASYNYNETAFHEISDQAKNFVDHLLILDATKRMSAEEALNHRWIKEGPSSGAKAGHMKRARENLKSYLANYRARWQRAGNVMIAAHRLRTHMSTGRGSAETPACVTQTKR